MGSEKKAIWIINQYASHLETRHLEMAKSFAQHGYRVAVITSSFHHGRHEYMFDAPVQFVERSENVFFVYLRSEPKYHNNGGKRVLNMLNFCRRFSLAQNEIKQRTGKPFFVIGSSAHPFVWESAWSCAKRYHAKFVAEFRDIWPRSLVEIQGVSPRHPFVILLGMIEKRAYRRADAIVSTMEYGYKHVCKVSGVAREKVYWIPNGINTDETDVVLASNLELPEELAGYLKQHWCCVYTGSISQGEHVDYLVEVFRHIKNSEIRLAIVGEGNYKENIQALINDYGLSNVCLFPGVNKDQVHIVLEHAACCVAAMPDLPIYQFGLSKYKLNDYLYSGKPVIFACNVDNMVKVAGHFGIQYGNPEKMAEAIESVKQLPADKLEELKNSGKCLIKEQYDWKTIGKKYVEILENL